MSFINNPVISDLMSATGLNQVLGSSAAQAAIPKSPQPIQEYKVARPPVNPRFAGPQGVPGGGLQLHVPGTEPGLMSADTLQSPNVHDLLAHYGVTAPQNIDDHLFIHDPQAFAKHPLIAGMLEQGLGGLANYQEGHDTASTLSNIAGSVIGNQSMHAQAYNNRAMAPIMQAQQIGSLMENKQRMDQQAAQTGYEQAHQKWYEGQFENAGQLTDARTSLIGAQTELAKANARSKDNSPAGMFADQFHTRLAALDPTGKGDESKVDPKAASDLYTQMLGEQSKAQAAGKVAVQQVKNQGTLGAASIRANSKGGANSKLDQGSAATDKELVGAEGKDGNAGTGLKGVQAEYNYLDTLSKLPADQRTYASLKNTKAPATTVSDLRDDNAIEARKQELATQAGKLHQQRAKLYASRGMTYTGIQPDAPAAAPASTNPFRQ